MANQVIFTDADQAAMSAIKQVYPSSLKEGRGRGWRRGGAEAGGEGRASTGRGEGRGEGRGGAEGGRGSVGPGVLAAGLSVLQPAAGAGATRAGSMGLNTTPANSAHAFGASRMPLQSLSNAGIDAPCGGGEQASPSLEVQRRCEQSRCDLPPIRYFMPAQRTCSPYLRRPKTSLFWSSCNRWNVRSTQDSPGDTPARSRDVPVLADDIQHLEVPEAPGEFSVCLICFSRLVEVWLGCSCSYR